MLQFMRNLLLIFVLALMVSSCKIFRSNLMLKTPKEFTYDKLSDSLSRIDYRIAPNDAIAYRILPNKGFKMVDMASGNTNMLRNELDVIVRSDGYIKLPLLDSVKVAGLTLKMAEKLIEKLYSEFYVDPFVNLKVTNRRVIIFPGNGGDAKVVPLVNNNTTVMEALAAAGGIVQDGKAYKVKLIRNAPGSEKPLVYLMDLSEIDGIKFANSIVQSGDIIYAEPRYRPLTQFNREITPIISLLTSVLILYQFTRLAR